MVRKCFDEHDDGDAMVVDQPAEVHERVRQWILCDDVVARLPVGLKKRHEEIFAALSDRFHSSYVDEDGVDVVGAFLHLAHQVRSMVVRWEMEGGSGGEEEKGHSTGENRLEAILLSIARLRSAVIGEAQVRLELF